MTEERWQEISEIIESEKYRIDSENNIVRDYDNSPYMSKPHIEGSVLISFDKKDYDLNELKEYIECEMVVIIDIMRDYVSGSGAEFFDVIIKYNKGNTTIELPYSMEV
jgi:hypothetical protein